MSRRIQVLCVLPLFLCACSGESIDDGILVQPAQTAGLGPKPTAAALTPEAGPAAASVSPSASAPRAGSSERAVDLSGFVPADAFLWLQLASIDDLDVAGSKLAGLVSEEAAQGWNLDVILMQALMMLPGADAQAIDRSRPLGVAVAFGPGAPQPLPTFVLPVGDPERFVSRLTPMPGAADPVIEGDYVAISMLPDYELGGAPPRFARNMPDAQVALRIDLGRVIPQFRPMIEMGLEEVRNTVDSMPTDPEFGELQGEVAGAYLDGASSFMDSAEVLELSLSLVETRMRCDLSVSMKDGSSLAGFGSPVDGELERFAGFLEQDAMFSAVGCFDAQKLRDQFSGLFEALAQSAPAGTMPEESIELMWDFMDLYGSTIAVDGDFGPGQLNAAYYSDPADHDAFFEGFQRVAAAVEESSAGSFKLTGPMQTRIDDLRLAQYRLDMGDAPTPEAREMQSMFTAMNGERPLMMTLAATPGYVATIVSSDDDFTDRALARLAAGSAQAQGELGQAVASVSSANPAFVYTWDLARLMQRSAAMAQRMAEVQGLPLDDFEAMPEIPEGLRATMTSFFGIDGRHWRGGFLVDVESLMALFHSVAD